MTLGGWVRSESLWCFGAHGFDIDVEIFALLTIPSESYLRAIRREGRLDLQATVISQRSSARRGVGGRARQPDGSGDDDQEGYPRKQQPQPVLPASRHTPYVR